MASEPIIPEELAQEVVYGQLGSWLGSQKGISEKYPTGHACALTPAISIPSNEVLGLHATELKPSRPQILPKRDRSHLRLWFTTDLEFTMEAVTDVLESLKWCEHPVIYTCAGNGDGICHRISVHRTDLHAIGNLVAGAFSKLRLQDESSVECEPRIKSSLQGKLLFSVIKPPDPFWGLFEVPELFSSSIHASIASVESEVTAVYQVVFQPVPTCFRDSIRTLAKAESIAARRQVGQGSWIFQAENPASSAKLVQGLFSAAIRLAVCGEVDRRHLTRHMKSLEMALAGIRFSSETMNLLRDSSFREVSLNAGHLKQSLISGKTYVPGVIVSAQELASFLPFPHAEEIGEKTFPLDYTPAFLANLHKENGVMIAQEEAYGKKRPVIWPQSQRAQHMMISGGTGSGKTVCVAGLASRIVNERPDEGMAIIDPHDTAIEMFTRSLDAGRIDDCILHDPMDDEYVLCLPLFDCPDPDQVDTAMSNITHQVCALFSRSDMGFNIVRGIKKVIRTLLICPELSLIDVRKLLDPTMSGGEVRERITDAVSDEPLIDYWANEFDNLDKGTIGRIRSRFEHIFESRRLAPLLANKLRKLDYTEIVNSNLIFLARTSPPDAGADLASILGTLHMTGLQTAAYSRKPDAAKQAMFTIIADEFGNYSNPRTVSHALRTLRKFNVSEVLVTQNIESLPDDVISAVGNVAAHIVFNQGWDDAQHYFKTFCGSIPTAEFLMKEVGQGYAKIGTRLAAISCPMPPAIQDASILEEIRANTRERYCVPKKEFCERMVDEKRADIEDLKNLDLL